MEKQNELITSRNLKLLVIFIISYLALFLLANWQTIGNTTDITGLKNWNFSPNILTWDYSLFLLPIAGFFLMYLLINWVEDYFETKFTRSIGFPVLILVLSFAAFFIAVFWLNCNLVSLAISACKDFGCWCSKDGAGATMGILMQQEAQRNIILGMLSPITGIIPYIGQLLSSRFMTLYLESPYFVFIVGAIFGLASKIIIDRTESK